MKKTAILLLLSLFVAAVVVLFVYRLGQRDSTTKGQRLTVPLVKVSPPLRTEVIYSLQSTGDILPIQQANIYSKVSGNLEKTFVEMGTPVRQDQLLALIDTTELALQYQQAEATYLNARISYDRTKDLYDRNLTSKEDNDNAEMAINIAKANCDLAATRLSYAWIKAPFPGIITRRFLDAGALVNPTNTTLFTLMDLTNVKVIVNVLEKDIPQVELGQMGRVTVDAFPGEEFTGRVARFSHAVDPDTRTMAVEIDVPNSGQRLKPGMFASVALIVGRRQEALTVPTPAVLRDDQGNYLYIARADTARKVRITTGAVLDSSIEILSGLPDTTVRVLVVGQQLVKDGGPILIQP